MPIFIQASCWTWGKTHLALSSYQIYFFQHTGTVLLFTIYLLGSINERDSAHRRTKHCRSSCIINSKGKYYIFLFVFATEGVRPVWHGAKQPKQTHIWLSILNSNKLHISLVLHLNLKLVLIFNCFIFKFLTCEFFPMAAHS